MQKSEEHEDLRVRRTRKLLQQAFIEGTIEKGFAALTVRDITERAMVNRSTFYRHYLDKYDLLEHYMNEIMPSVAAHETGAEPHPREASVGLVNLLTHIRHFAAFYHVMLGIQGDPVFEQRLRQQAGQRMLAVFWQTFPDAEHAPYAPPLDLTGQIVAAAGCGAIAWWLEQETPDSPEQLAQWLYQYIDDIVTGATRMRA